MTSSDATQRLATESEMVLANESNFGVRASAGRLSAARPRCATGPARPISHLEFVFELLTITAAGRVQPSMHEGEGGEVGVVVSFRLESSPTGWCAVNSGWSSTLGTSRRHGMRAIWLQRHGAGMGRGDRAGVES